MLINRDFLCSTDAHFAARLLIKGKALPQTMEPYREAADYVVSAVEAGWFSLPHWAETGAYSREQFNQLSRLLQRHPDLPRAIEVAEIAMSHAEQAFRGPLFELIGSARTNRLPDPVSLAKSAPYSCPRMPPEFVAGNFTAVEFCDLLDDVAANCEQVQVLASLLTRPGMLDPSTCLAAKINYLHDIGRPGWIPAIVRSVHYRFLSIEAIAELRKLAAGADDGRTFIAFVEKDQRQREEATRTAWRGWKRMIGRVASVLAEARSFNQAALTKYLRRELGQRFGVENQGGRLVVNTDSHLVLGTNGTAATGFELVNWVLALDNAFASQPDDLDGYWKACEEATAALARMRDAAA